MPLTKKKLDDLWRSGYCRETVEQAKKLVIGKKA